MVCILAIVTHSLSHSSKLFVKVMCQEFRSLKKEVPAPSSVKFPLAVTASVNLLLETKQLCKDIFFFKLYFLLLQ